MTVLRNDGRPRCARRTHRLWGLIRPHRATIYVALATLSVSTLLGPAPLYGTKIVFDNILGDRPLPQRLTRIVALPADRLQLLGVVVVAMGALAVACELVGCATQARERSGRSG